MSRTDPRSYRAVIFDLGGVVLGSPLHAIAAYEREIGIPANFINRVVMDTAPVGAWSRLERGELSMEAFYEAFDRDCAEAGREISAQTMMERIAVSAGPRPAMLEAVTRIKERELSVAALTNNWASADSETRSHGDVRDHFDVFIESSVEGLRKPDPQIYQLACERLSVTPVEAIFLDDIGANLKPARELGMTTIKVVTPEAALAELSQLLDFSLSAGP
jgi:putative hydrolase of the HAD superfamily